jgi:hypothetical protein
MEQFETFPKFDNVTVGVRYGVDVGEDMVEINCVSAE